MKVIQCVATLTLIMATSSFLVFGQTSSAESAWTDSNVDLAGTEFRVAFIQHVPPNDVVDYKSSDQTLALYLSNVGTANATVEIQYAGLPSANDLNCTIVAGETEKVKLNSSLVLQGAGRHVQSVHITCDEKILIQASMGFTGNNKLSLGGFSVLPVAALSTDYVVVTHCVIKNCVIVVLATENHTNVTVSLRIKDGGKADFNNQTFPDGEEILVTGLSSGHSIQVLCFACDMTGTRIQTNKKVAVFSGGEFTKFLDMSNKDLVLEQMIPLNAIGREYVLGSIYVTDVATLLKIVPLQAGDRFLYNNVSYAATIDRQVFEFESNITEIVHVLADIPVFVGQLTGCTTAGNNPDLTMTLPVPVDQWETSYQMYVSSNKITSSKRNETFLCLLVPRETDVAVQGSESLATVSQMTQGDYVLLTVEVMTDGLVTVRCVNSTNCQPFTGYMLHNKRSRSSAFAMRYFLQEEEVTTTEVSSTEAVSSNTPSSAAISSTSPIPSTTFTETLTSDIPASSTDTTTDMPESSTDTTSIIPESSTDTTSSIPESSTDTTGSIPESSTDTTTNIPESSTDTTTNIPALSTDTTTNIPESSTDTTTNIPESSTDTTTNISESSTDTTTNIPESSTDTTTNIPESSTDTTTNISESSTDTTTNIPESSKDTPTNNPESSTVTTTNIPESSTDTTTNIPESSTDTTTNNPKSSTDTTTNIPESSTDTTTNIPESLTHTTTNIAESSTDTTTNNPESSTDTTTNIPESSKDTTTNIPESSTVTTTSIPESSTDSTTNNPESSTDTTTNNPKSSTDTTTNIPESSTDTTTNIPESSTDTTTNIPESSTDTATNNPESSTDTTTNIPESSTDTATNNPESSTDTTTNIPESSTDTTTSIPESSTDTTTNIPESSTDTETNNPESSTDTTNNIPESSTDTTTNIPESTTSSLLTTTSVSSHSLSPSADTRVSTEDISSSTLVQHMVTTPGVLVYPPSQSPTRHLCSCRCTRKQARNTLQANSTEAMKAELTVERKRLSSYIRSKTSAVDPRTSSKVVGASVGLVCLVIMFGVIVGLDVVGCARHWSSCNNRVNSVPNLDRENGGEQKSGDEFKSLHEDSL